MVTSVMKTYIITVAILFLQACVYPSLAAISIGKCTFFTAELAWKPVGIGCVLMSVLKINYSIKE